MEPLHPFLGWTYFFTESTGLNAVIILSFLFIPILISLFFIFGYSRLESISGVVIKKRKEKRPTLWEYLGVTAGFSPQLGASEQEQHDLSNPCHCIYIRNKKGKVQRLVLSPAAYDNLEVNTSIQKAFGKPCTDIAILDPEVDNPTFFVQQGKGAYFKYIMVLIFRNFLIVSAITFMALGIAGLKSRVLYRTSVVSNEWNSIPFNVTGGTRMMLQVRKENPHPDINAVVLARNGSDKVNLMVADVYIPASENSDTGTMSGASLVVNFNEMVSPQILIQQSRGGRYYLSLVRTPSPIWGYMVLMVLTFSLSFYITVRMSRMVMANPEQLSRAVEYAGKGILRIAFFISVIIFIASGGYLVIKAIDHFFRTGIWLTYDHFIQDILYRFSK